MTLPIPPRTWDALSEISQECTKRNDAGDITQAGLDTSYKWAVYTQAMYSMVDGPIYDLDKCEVNLNDPDVQDAWEEATSFIVGPTASDAANFLPGKPTFKLGSAVFHINHPVTIGSMETEYPDIDYGAALPPTPDGSNKSFVHSWTYVVNKNSENTSTAWEFAYSMSDNKAQKEWFESTGALPATHETLDDPATAKNDIQEVALESLKGARNVETIPVDPDNVTDSAWDAIATGEDSVSEALADAKAMIDPQIQNTLDCE